MNDKVTMRQRGNASVAIRSTRDTSEYWQCGQWAKGARNATLYYDQAEAEAVIALRALHSVEIVNA